MNCPPKADSAPFAARHGPLRPSLSTALVPATAGRRCPFPIHFAGHEFFNPSAARGNLLFLFDGNNGLTT